jgi:hypothetical protein
LAAVALALVLVLSAGSATAPPAFAITRHDDGSLTVNLNEPNAGLIGTNRKLAARARGSTSISRWRRVRRTRAARWTVSRRRRVRTCRGRR